MRLLTRPTARHRQSAGRAAGTTLVEALITFLVLSLGLLAVSRVQGQLRLAGDTGRQRSEAVQLAQEDVEQLRGYARMAATSGVAGHSFAEVVDADRVIDAASGSISNTVYRLRRRVRPSMVAAARDVSVTVEWSDRAGRLQTASLETVLAANDPALSGALGIAPTVTAVNGPMGRAAQIPRNARNLGHGRSALTLDDGSGAVTIQFDNATGAIVERCLATKGPAAVESTTDFGACRPIVAYLLSGVVRFATGEASDRIEPARRASVALRTFGGSAAEAPDCSTTPVGTAAGDHYLQYVCIVYPPVGGRWSGETRLIPQGWALDGPGASGLQVCSEDGTTPEGSATVGRLGRYDGVSGTLVNQNFRIIRAGLACPA